MKRRSENRPWYLELGNRIAAAIEASGLSQAEVARRSRCTDGTVTRWKQGAFADPHRIPALCRTLGVSADYLLGVATAPGAVAESRPQYDPSGPGTASADSTVSTSEHPPESETEDMGQLLETLQQIAARQEEMARDLKTAADALVARSGRHAARTDASRGRPTVPRRPQRATPGPHRREAR